MDLITLAMAKKTGGGGVSSWNDLTDKPFGEEVTEGVITFDGDLTGKEYIDTGNGTYAVKISDYKLTQEEIDGSTIRVIEPVKNSIEDIPVGNVTGGTHAHVETIDMGNGAYGVVCHIPSGEQVVMVLCDGAGAIMNVSDGTYFLVKKDDGGTLLYTESISCLTGEVKTVKPLDAKFLPTDATVFHLTSPNGTKYAITVSDDGTLSSTKVTE